MFRIVGLCVWFCTLFVAPPAVLADGKVALVVGNSAYQNAGLLANPANDAEGMAGY